MNFGTGNLGGDEERGTWDSTILNGDAEIGFVAVDFCTVEMVETGLLGQNDVCYEGFVDVGGIFVAHFCAGCAKAETELVEGSVGCLLETSKGGDYEWDLDSIVQGEFRYFGHGAVRCCGKESVSGGVE